jgi:hypothetical protein
MIGPITALGKLSVCSEPEKTSRKFEGASNTSEFTERDRQRVEFEKFGELTRNPGNARNLERGGSG